jgi:hypothetical protein
MFQGKSPRIVIGLLGSGMIAGIICFAEVTADNVIVASQETAATGKPAGQEPLLDVARGQIPSDIGGNRPDNVKMTTEDCAELGGKALKVVFAGPDSFGDRQARVANWKGSESLQFDAFNSGRETVRLMLTIKHRQTTNYQTRVDVPVVLKSGKTSISIPVDSLANTNGSAPDLSEIERWYFALESPQAATFYLGNLWLVKEIAPASPAIATAPAPARKYRVTGKIGDMRVDLIVTPDEDIASAISIVAPAPQATKAQPAGDPARLDRIRAAKMPPIAKPVMFDTPESDAIVSALEVFPPDNPWNQVVSDWPAHPNSKNLIASIGSEKPFRCNTDMGFILVPPNQKRLNVKIPSSPGESDPGPYPVPADMPIEGWPNYYHRNSEAREKSLDDVQRDRFKGGGDRHAIVVDPINRMLYEFYQAKKTDSGWEASGAAIFDLKSNKLRPEGWTSTDAAGLPIFPAVVRYDELRRGIVEHAMRVTVTKTRRAYVAPATHFASRLVDVNLPRMGERLRLRQDFDISGFSPEVQAILKGLKKYGMFVADNGIDWAISVAPDERIPSLHEELRRITGSAFEVVQPPN